MIVERDIHALSPDAALLVPPIAMHAVADAPNRAELLDIEVDALARRGPFVALQGLRRGDRGQPLRPSRRSSAVTVDVRTSLSAAIRAAGQRCSRRLRIWRSLV